MHSIEYTAGSANGGNEYHSGEGLAFGDAVLLMLVQPPFLPVLQNGEGALIYNEAFPGTLQKFNVLEHSLLSQYSIDVGVHLSCLHGDGTVAEAKLIRHDLSEPLDTDLTLHTISNMFTEAGEGQEGLVLKSVLVNSVHQLFLFNV